MSRNPYQRETDWHGLYPQGGSRDDALFVASSVRHPAKMSLPLTRRILDQMEAWGWLRPGDGVLDPFGGRGTTAALWCARNPGNWAVTVEIEAPFVAMQEECRTHAERRLGRPLRWLAQRGDSRLVDRLLAGDLSSTRALIERELRRAWQADWSATGLQPFVGWARAQGYGEETVSAEGWVLEPRDAPGGLVAQLLAGVTSPPYGPRTEPGRRSGFARETRLMPHLRMGRSTWDDDGYGTTEGQIGRLPDPQAGLTSPPYGQSEVTHIGRSIGDTWRADGEPALPPELNAKSTRRYGQAEGQIGQLPDPQAVLSSPPYGTADRRAGGLSATSAEGVGDYPVRTKRPSHVYNLAQHGTTEGQIGALPDGPSPGGVSVAVTSPPYGDTEVMTPEGGVGAAWREGRSARETFAQEDRGARRYGRTEGQIGALPDAETPGVAITSVSPPYGRGTIGQADPERLRRLTEDPTSSLYGRDPDGAWFQAMAQGSAPGEGNIDALPDGPEAAVTSPPYEDSINARNGIDMSRSAHRRGSPASQAYSAGYAEPAASVTSPPYEASLASDDPDRRGGLFRDPKRRNDRTLTGTCGTPAASLTSPPYEAQSGGAGEASRARTPDPGVLDRCGYRTASNGSAEGQIGETQAETYASACLQVYAACARAGVRYLAVVTKNPTRDGKLRRLDKLTARLLRQAGYRVVAWRRAWLWETRAQQEERLGQARLFADEVPPSARVEGRVSFFKRIQMAKGSPAAQHEDVFFCILRDREGAEAGEGGAL